MKGSVDFADSEIDDHDYDHCSVPSPKRPRASTPCKLL